MRPRFTIFDALNREDTDESYLEQLEAAAGWRIVGRYAYPELTVYHFQR